ncbi:bifunctional glutamate--cysteine ligase GshA/glutathione synthetase GshB [Acetobacterium bakii]|uniref:Carboxylate--amine ligase n=1 Tax=Acetobacterium bakii TaxID=52689 RepID=A0A0L6U1Q3_9FIRM|nr:bifunctional glutamate--cysteine ligase GshA/glutathione synthetase GshB [Acetobacterium bakii]KNZ41735.1 carboxylate--amine ligase [Acetobacterium bakii]
MQSHNYEGLELSTVILIKAAEKRGILVDILDRENNFIRLKKASKIEYVKQATKTSLDSYIVPLIMENKEVTKLVLRENAINVPMGIKVKTIEEAFKYCHQFDGRDLVIKPNTTNFGLGVVILKELQCETNYRTALETAFNHDDSVLIEEFISGKEYRFLIIGKKVVAILHRIPANVMGDGIHTFEELVAEKNKNPLRGTGYVKPLEKIKLEHPEIDFLKAQKKSINDIPPKGETVFLRENSNISTGGDSIDFTDDIMEAYKAIAVHAAKAVGAKICGVDMIIQDISRKPDAQNYSIIELNFNPALHIHNYPYVGQNRHVEENVLNLLGF